MFIITVNLVPYQFICLFYFYFYFMFSPMKQIFIEFQSCCIFLFFYLFIFLLPQCLAQLANARAMAHKVRGSHLTRSSLAEVVLLSLIEGIQFLFLWYYNWLWYLVNEDLILFIQVYSETAMIVYTSSAKKKGTSPFQEGILIFNYFFFLDCSGLSLISQELTAMFLAVRLYCSIVMEYDIHTVLDLATLAATVWVIYMIRFKLNSSFMYDKDNFSLYYLVSIPMSAIPLLFFEVGMGR